MHLQSVVTNILLNKRFSTYSTLTFICPWLGSKQIRYNTSATDYEYVLVPGADSDSVLISGLMPDTYYNLEMTLVTYTYGNYSFRTAKSVVVMTTPLPSKFVLIGWNLMVTIKP